MNDRDTVPRGRHAPPLEVRQDRQLQRLSEAAAAVFARTGYADATAEAIARALGMSPRTVHKHLQRLYAALDVHDRLGAVDRARALGLL